MKKNKKHMTMKISILKITALLAFTFFMTSCQKDEPLEEQDFESAQSLSNSESVMDDLDDEAAFRMTGSSSSSTCATITYANPISSFPNTVTIDFGTTGCVGPMGHVRKGKIIVEVSGSYFTPGSVRSVTSDGFSVDDWAVEGTRTVTNLGENADGQLQWSVVVSNATLTDPNEGQGTWSTSRIRTLLEGMETEGIEDDVYEITGTANGTNRNGKTWEASITVPLLKPMSCRWIVSGTVETAVQGRNGVHTLDFGNGDCDDKGIVTGPNGFQREITLRR